MAAINQLLKVLGIVGSGVSRDTLSPMLRGPTAGEEQQREWEKAGVVQNPEVWGIYGNYMQQPETLDQQMLLWHEMLSWDLVGAALKELSEEATQPDFVTGHTLWFECTDKNFEKKLMKLRDALGVEEHLQSQTWHVAGYGNNFEKLHYEAGQGVTGISFAHPIDVRRYWLAKNRQCVGFMWKQENPPETENFQVNGATFVRGTIQGGGAANVPKNLWFPWDFLHMRRMQRSRINEHGEPIFKEAQGIYKKLRLALDQMVVHRLQIQPDRYVVNIDTKDQPPAEQMRTVQRWQQMMRKKMAFGAGQSQANLTVTDFRSQYDPMALDTVLYMPIPRDTQHAINKLAGTPQVPDVFDIELLMNLFFSIMGMPLSWLGVKSGGGGGDSQQPASGKALLAQDMRFLRQTRSVRKGVIDGYTWLAYFHALLTNEKIDDLNISAKMSDISGLEDQIKLELLQMQIDLLDKLGSALGNIGVPTHVMVDLVFRRYMRLPDDVVNAVITALPSETPPPGQQENVNTVEHKIRQLMLTESKTTQKIMEIVKVLRSNDAEMRRFLNETSRAEAIDRLPKKGEMASLMESIRRNDNTQQILMETKLDLTGSMPPAPTPAVGRGDGRVEGSVGWQLPQSVRGFYGRQS
jgi:hypothetical protein